MPNAIGMRANARTSMTAKPIRDSAMDQVPADGHGGRRARRARQSRTAAVVPAIAAIRVATGAIGMLRNGLMALEEYMSAECSHICPASTASIVAPVTFIAKFWMRHDIGLRGRNNNTTVKYNP